MAKVKYCIKEFTPTANQTGGHSFYAQPVVDNIITNKELAAKIQARTGTRSYEALTVLAAAAEIILEETMENNRVQLETGDGGSLVSIFPRVVGSISDKDVQANPQKYNGATVATEDMLTPDMLQWSLGAQVGTKFSKQFAMNKQAQKVDGTNVPAATEEEPTPTPTPSGDGGDEGDGRN